MIAPVYYEWYVAMCIIVPNIASGISLGIPAIFGTILTSNATNNNEMHFTKDEVSWITASYSITGPVGYLLIPTLMQIFGRRFACIIINTLMLIGGFLIATATNQAALIAGRAVQGIVFCEPIMSSIIIAEYSHPKRRGILIIFRIITVYASILLCHGLSAVLDWRQITWFGCVPSAIGILVPLTWPETPYWLAYKGRFDDCRKVFKQLRGNNVESKQELKEIISAQQKLAKQKASRNSSIVFWILNVFCTKELLGPIGIILLTNIIIHATGTYFLYAYIIQIIREITGDEAKALYFTCGIDFMKVVASSLTLLLERNVRRKVLLTYCSSISFILLGLMCITDYLNKTGIINIVWLPTTIMFVYCFALNVGFIPILALLLGECYPLKHKGLGITICGIINSILGAIILKLTSNMLTNLKTYGTFAVYLLISICAMLLLLAVLPETKDKTLQNIENEMTRLKVADNENHEQNSEETTKILMK